MGRPNKGEKYHLIREGAHKRLVADKDFYCHGILIRAGKCGGLVDGSHNVSQSGSCWVTEDACVMGDSTVRDDALVTGDSIITGGAKVLQNATVEDDCQVSNGAIIRGNARISGSVAVSDGVVIGRDMSAGVYFDINGKLFRDAVLNYDPDSGQLRVNNYAAPQNLNVNIKSYYSVNDRLAYCRIVGHANKKKGKNNE